MRWRRRRFLCRFRRANKSTGHCIRGPTCTFWPVIRRWQHVDASGCRQTGCGSGSPPSHEQQRWRQRWRQRRRQQQRQRWRQQHHQRWRHDECCRRVHRRTRCCGQDGGDGGRGLRSGLGHSRFERRAATRRRGRCRCCCSCSSSCCCSCSCSSSSSCSCSCPCSCHQPSTRRRCLRHHQASRRRRRRRRHHRH